MAHELRTPLNTVKPIVALLMTILHRETPKYSRIMQFLKIVHNSSIHLESVIEDALDISRLENNKFSLVMKSENVGAIMQEVMEVMQF